MHLLVAEFGSPAKHDKRLDAAYAASLPDRVQLWTAAAATKFEQPDWEPDPDRVTRAARAVVRILTSLPP